MTTSHDENSPLLHDHEGQISKPITVPIPKCMLFSGYPIPTHVRLVQLSTLFLVRIVEPIAYMQIFPYINEFIVYLRIADQPSSAGFYSGLVVCSLYRPVPPGGS